MPYLFCNIAWMNEYQGHRRINQPEDQPQRGGRWVLEHGTAHECCNFLSDEDGNVYGHVETWRGDEDGYDTQIRIEKLGADIEDAYVEGVDVIWLATHENGGRLVVGWYKNARVYRNRQFFEYYPTHQHQRDNVDSYRIAASVNDVFVITESERKFNLGTGGGWPGRSPLFYPADHADNRHMAPFLERLNKFIGLAIKQQNRAPIGLTFRPAVSSLKCNARV